MKLETKMAEQQLLGFLHGVRGYSIVELIEAMALTKEEWIEINKKFNLDITDIEKSEVEEYFKIK